MYILMSSIRFSMPKSVNAMTPVFTYAANPDGAGSSFSIPFATSQGQSVLSEVLGNAIDGKDGMNFVDVQGYAAWMEGVDTGGVPFQGNTSCRRLCGMLAMRVRTSAS
ncbi:hypothetical protein ACVIHF_008782 [Bradyrhizobium sp. USDA 4506]